MTRTRGRERAVCHFLDLNIMQHCEGVTVWARELRQTAFGSCFPFSKARPVRGSGVGRKHRAAWVPLGEHGALHVCNARKVL